MRVAFSQVGTFTEWTDVKPGFLEGDLVAHCGGTTDGAFLYPFTLTDVATTWTECLALLHRSQHGVVQALNQARRLFPFPILGIDTDNGSEFINEELLAYCTSEQITFTRGRVGNKNDQCFVELCELRDYAEKEGFGKLRPLRWSA